jgi:hypothetical protein
VCEFAPQLGGDEVAILAVDCHPWHGLITLALLTAEEVQSNPLLVDPAEMAAWRHYDFTRASVAWQPVTELGREMQTAYERGQRSDVAEAFLRACAEAVSSPLVAAALGQLSRADAFRLSVTHPDDNREFVLTS